MSLNDCFSSEVLLWMHDGLASHSHFIALFFKFLGGAGQNWERAEVHWNNKMWGWQEILDGVGGLSWTHAKAVTDWEASDVGLVELVNQFHVREDIGVSSVIDSKIVVWDLYDKTAGTSSSYLDTLWTDTSRWVICSNHGDLSEAEVLGASLLHFSDESWWDLAEKLVVGSYLG